MLYADLEKAVLSLPFIRALHTPLYNEEGVMVRPASHTPEQIQASILSLAPMVVCDIVRDFEFDFGTEVATKASTANVATYRFEGLNDDCFAVMSIRYGDSNKLLDKFTSKDMDRLLSGDDGSEVGVAGWYLERYDNGFPEITIVRTPDSAETMTYRYIRKNLGVEDWPEDFALALVYGVAAALIPDYTPVFQEKLKTMRSFYARQKNEAEPPMFDQDTVNRNIERWRMDGYGGTL